MAERGAAALTLLLAGVLTLALPLAGVATAGGDIARYFEFPPLTRYVAHAAFSWPVTFSMLLFTAACVAPFVLRIARTPPRPGSGTPARFPAWGYAGLALTGAGWVVAWTRVEALAPVQIYTFLPLWYGYVLVVNALVLARRGSCPLTAAPLGYLALFPLSAAFWWLFEYLNRFVQNWYYRGIEHLGAGEYVFWSTLAFATVLPAVSATRELITTVPRLSAGLERGPVVAPRYPRVTAAALGCAALLALAAIGRWPDYTFPLLWLAPLALLCALSTLLGQPNVFARVAVGDWREVWTWPLAALVCGFWWETWNAYSAASWAYSVPFVSALHVFEMPLAGYAGYLPFGLECGAVSLLCARLARLASVRRRGRVSPT